MGRWSRSRAAGLKAALVLALVAAAPAHAAFPGPDGRIAFSSSASGTGQIQTMDADGSRVTQVTSGSANSGPAWSWAARRLAFVSRRDGNDEIYTMKPDGSDLKRLTRHPGSDYDPAFSPDGRWIAFVSTRDGHAKLFVTRADGSSRVQQLTTADALHVQPAWSPRGDRIAYVSSASGRFEVYVIDLANHGRTSKVAIDLPGSIRQPSWSPDAKRLAVVACRRPPARPGACYTGADAGSEIYVHDLAGGPPAQVTDVHPRLAGEPAFSPRGSRIAFVSQPAGKLPASTEIRTVMADGTSEQLISPGTRGVQRGPDWAQQCQYTLESASAEPQPQSVTGDRCGTPPSTPALPSQQTTAVALGDSAVSGEGAGSYETGTAQPVNGSGDENLCHRSAAALIHRTAIPGIQRTLNFACSGATSSHLWIGGETRYAKSYLGTSLTWSEATQSDQLARAARRHEIKLVFVEIGTNDNPGPAFGDVAADCATRYLNFTESSKCNSTYRPVWQSRLDAMAPKVERAISDIREVMRREGYADGSYQLVQASYWSPVTDPVPVLYRPRGTDYLYDPEYQDKIEYGCPFYNVDLAWGHDEAVPALNATIRAIAQRQGVRFLDLHRSMEEREACGTGLVQRSQSLAGESGEAIDNGSQWVNGLKVTSDPNKGRQSLHANANGHAQLGKCLREFYALSGQPREGGCRIVGGQLVAYSGSG